MTDRQRSSWDSYLSAGASRIRNCSLAVRIIGALDVDLLRRCIDAVILRHQALRTRFVVVDGVPMQHIDAASGNELRVIDLSDELVEQRADAASRSVEAFIHEQFDPRSDPLFASRLLRLSDREHVLAIAIDHLVADGGSLKILDEELWSIYASRMSGRLHALGQPPLQFGDYAAWQDQTRGDWLRQHGSYWQEILSDAPSIEIPVHALPDGAQPVPTETPIALGSVLSAELVRAARREKTLPALLVFAAYTAALSRLWGHTDLLVKFYHNNRDRPELMQLVGYVVDPQYLRLTIHGRTTFVDLLRQLGTQVRSAAEHPTYGRLNHLIPGLRTELSFNWSPVNWADGTVSEARELAPGLNVEPFPLRRRPMLCKFDSIASQTPSGIVVNLYHRADCISAAGVEAFARDLTSLTERLVQRPMSRIAAA